VLQNVNIFLPYIMAAGTAGIDRNEKNASFSTYAYVHIQAVRALFIYTFHLVPRSSYTPTLPHSKQQSGLPLFHCTLPQRHPMAVTQSQPEMRYISDVSRFFSFTDKIDE